MNRVNMIDVEIIIPLVLTAAKCSLTILVTSFWGKHSWENIIIIYILYIITINFPSNIL